MSLDIVSLARSGAVANLTVRLTNNDQAGGSNRLGVQVAQLFGTYRGPVQLIDSMAGIALIDAADNKKYPVAKDTSGACVCDANLASTFVAAGQSVMLSASFAAPPPNVSRVDVLVPHFGTSHQVPIS